jgi:hypothetical protein
MLECIVNTNRTYRVKDSDIELWMADFGFGDTVEDARENYLHNLDVYVGKVIRASSKIRIQKVNKMEMIVMKVDDFGREYEGRN